LIMSLSRIAPPQFISVDIETRTPHGRLVGFSDGARPLCT
jgi:hypothetical protein